MNKSGFMDVMSWMSINHNILSVYKNAWQVMTISKKDEQTRVERRAEVVERRANSEEI
jgi:hypothetical protein